MRLSVLACIILASPAVAWSDETPNATSQDAATSSPAVEWYHPDIGISTNVNRSRIILLGKASPNAKITMSGDIYLIDSKHGKTSTMKTKDADATPVAIADKRGIFDFELELPFQSAQMTFEITDKDGHKSLYQLFLDVGLHEVNILNQKNVNVSPYSRRKWGLWGGLGLNFLAYEQTSTIPSDLSFNSISLPTLFAKVVRTLSRDWALQATYNRAPGSTKSSSNIRFDQNSYTWSFFTGELTYYPKSWKVRHKHKFSEFGLQVGLQHHSVPFMTRSSEIDSNAAIIETNEVSMAAIGLTWLTHYNRYWMSEVFIRYEAPFASGSLFDISTKLAFDGSLGVIYKWAPDWRAGFFWYGNYLNFDFKNHKDKYFAANPPPNDPNISGNESLFFSNLELRLGWEFD